jgi:hypothetical protein
MTIASNAAWLPVTRYRMVAEAGLPFGNFCQNAASRLHKATLSYPFLLSAANIL